MVGSRGHLPLERYRELVPSLLARAIRDLPEPSTGSEECKDCELLDAIMRLAAHPDAAGAGWLALACYAP